MKSKFMFLDQLRTINEILTAIRTFEHLDETIQTQCLPIEIRDELVKISQNLDLPKISKIADKITEKSLNYFFR